MNSNIQYLNTDTTFILNKLGKDEVSYNPQLKKHAINKYKISIITDNCNVPISIMCTKGSIHDLIILQKHLDKLYIEHPILYDNTKTIIVDAAYGKIT